MTGSGVAGTPSYMAPELHTGDSAGVESDVYSLGCLLWAAVAGTAPYRGTSDFQIATAHFVEPVPQLVGDGAVITEINQILRKAMAKQPEDRYASAAAFRDDLRRAQSLAQGSESVAPGRSAPSASGDPAPRRRRLAAVVAALAVVVVVGVAATAFALKDREDDPVSDPDSDPTTISQSGTTTPTSPATSVPPADGDRAKAEASLSQGLQTTGGLTEAQADCTAREWLAGDGLQAMIDDGFFDENMVYQDQDQSEMSPEMKQAAVAATIECAGAT
jgi:serine/threonine-protein kinase